ncbi:VTT domain-containing protein [uncultured Piscinibacter sp.]|uniref:DedA family protein n=1 Tax=uncultured Piscinibacter sp. TaxID=1131835 RepID=UPI00261B338F|nr:VTT domain-containing protein [uncultured Piscinibacter sp.]
MLSDGSALSAAFEAALAGMAEPWAVCLALALTTLLLEDLAIAAGVAVAAQGLLAWPLSFAAVAGGIAAGDLGLYALGLGARRWRWLQRRIAPSRHDWVRGELVRRLAGAVLLARVIPGLRLVTYTACGYLRVPPVAFGAWVLLAVVLWTAGLYAASVSIGRWLTQAWGLSAPLAVALPIVVLAVAVPLWRAIRSRSTRRPT